jgi:TRAP-type C4-dicarboxylate transport system permease small subunit
MPKNKDSLFYTAMKYFLALLMMATTVLVFYQIIMRYIFNMAPSWSEETARYCFIWLSFIGAGMGLRDRIHIGVDAVVNLLPLQGKRAAAFVVDAIICVFGIFIIIHGKTVMELTMTQFSPAMGLPMSFVYMAAPAMGALLVMYSALDVVNILRGRRLAKTESEPC